MSLSAIPVQLQVTTLSNPPVPPIDLNTGEWPCIWRGSDTVFNTGIFDSNGVSVDLSNLASLTLSILPYVDVKNYLGFPQSACLSNVIDGDLYVPGLNWPSYPTSYPALVTVTVDAEDLETAITFQQWQAALVENSAFLVAASDTATIDLQGQPFKRFTLAVSGTLTEGGSRIIYGSGPIMIYESGITLE